MRALIRHTIKPEHLDVHLELLHAAHTELQTLQPADFEWTIYRVGDTGTFIEYTAGPHLPQPLPTLPAFRRYRADLEQRREGPGEFLELHRIASYNSRHTDPEEADGG